MLSEKQLFASQKAFSVSIGLMFDPVDWNFFPSVKSACAL